jgi:SAM-dependent methyltransferase
VRTCLARAVRWTSCGSGEGVVTDSGVGADGSSGSQDGERAGHWDAVYGRSAEDAVSWFESEPRFSLELLDLLGVELTDPVIDVGAGASRLVDALLGRGFSDVTVLDVSDVGLAKARRRLGDRAERVRWVVADLLSWQPARRYRVWHDRAVFHFLTDPADQARYRELLGAALAPGAAVVVGTFAVDGPDHCSGLPTARYSPQQLSRVLGAGIEPVMSRRELHRTPWDAVQAFTWLAARRCYLSRP